MLTESIKVEGTKHLTRSGPARNVIFCGLEILRILEGLLVKITQNVLSNNIFEEKSSMFLPSMKTRPSFLYFFQSTPFKIYFATLKQNMSVLSREHFQVIVK